MEIKEELRDGVIKFIIKETCLGRWKPDRLAEVILYYLKAKGVVVKDNRVLPNEVLDDGRIAYIEDII